MNYILFEDEYTKYLKPFTEMHASFEVRCGQFTNIERILSLLEPTDTITLIVRKEIEPLLSERFKNITINPDIIEPGLWLNGATIWNKELIKQVKDGKSYSYEEILFAFLNSSNQDFNKLKKLISSKKNITSHIELPHISFLWDAILKSSNQINEDFKKMFPKRNGNIHPSTILVKEENIYCGENTNITAGVILDASKGPIIIENNIKIDIGSLLQGPLIIGHNSIINPGTKLRGNVIIGPMCKVGGEIEDSIIHGYSNKQHDGFLGHSYIGEWVNLGANTNNSNLKNTYGEIQFIFPDVKINTGEIFIGAMIGDYVKTGISTMLNTGTYIGTGANIFGGDFQDKYIPSFQWGKKDTVQWKPFIKTCNRIKKRRNKNISKEEEFRLKTIYKSD